MYIWQTYIYPSYFLAAPFKIVDNISFFFYSALPEHVFIYFEKFKIKKIVYMYIFIYI